MPSGLMGTIYTKSKSGFMENPYFEKLADFFYVHVEIGWIGPMRPKCAFGDQKASFRIKTCHLAIPRIMGQKIADF